jgi:hypothetical protein
LLTTGLMGMLGLCILSRAVSVGGTGCIGIKCFILCLSIMSGQSFRAFCICLTYVVVGSCLSVVKLLSDRKALKLFWRMFCSMMTVVLPLSAGTIMRLFSASLFLSFRAV